MKWQAIYHCGPRRPLFHGVHTETIEASTTAEAWKLANDLAPAETFELRGGHSAVKFGNEILHRMIPMYVKSPEPRLETFGYARCGRRVKVSVCWNIRTGGSFYSCERECITAGNGVPEFFCTGQVGGDGNSFEWCGRVDGDSDPLVDYIKAKSTLKELDHDFMQVCRWGRHHFHTEFKHHFAPGPETLDAMEKLTAKYAK